MSDNWVVQNLTNALETWNDKLSEIWLLITQSPENFKGGAIWSVIVSIHGALQAIGYALLVVFFVVGVMKTCGSFTELKRPEVAFKCFIRFVLAVGSGFAYYSLSSILITQLKEPFLGVQLATELGTIALMANIMREIMALLGAPLFVKYFGRLSPICAGGATTMDTTLPIITRYSGKDLVFISIFHGIIVDFTVPFFVSFFCSF